MHISKRLHDLNSTWNSINFEFRINNNKKKRKQSTTLIRKFKLKEFNGLNE